MQTLKKEEFIIRTFDDILNALRERPDWAEELRKLVLTEELIALPKKFEDFRREEFRPLKEKVDKIEQDVTGLKEDMIVVKQDVAILKEDVTVLKQDVTVLKQDVTVLKQDVTVLKQDVTVLKEDVTVLKQDVAILKQDVAILKEDVAILKQDVAVLKQDVATLKGNDFERTVRERAPAYFGRLIRRCRGISFEQLADKLDDAIDAGLIRDEDKAEAILVDAVVTGKLKTGKEVILAVEVSLKVDTEDVERAARRANIISQAYGIETIGVAVGKEYSEKARRIAEDLNVVLV